MLKRFILLAPLVLALGVLISAQGARPLDAARGRRVALGDWPDARGPHRDGVSDEKGLVETWALNGRNFLWKAPYGGRPPPPVMGNRVHVAKPAGRGGGLQEGVIAAGADTRQPIR